MRALHGLLSIGVGAIVIASCAGAERRAAVPAATVAAPAPVGDAGCPEEEIVKDSDNDGLPDDCDRCPNIPGEHRRGGCPYVQLDVAIIKIPTFVSFERNGLKPSFEHLPDEVVRLLKEERLKRIGVVGHVLSGERDAAHLAMRRAEVVKDALVARGVPVAKFELRAAPVGNSEGCPAVGDGGAPAPCVTFNIVESDAYRMEWDGTHYVDKTPPPPPEPPFECPPHRPRDAGPPCPRP